MNFLAQYQGNGLQDSSSAPMPGMRWGMIVILFAIIIGVIGMSIWGGLAMRSTVSAGYRGYSETMASLTALKQKQFTESRAHAESATSAWKAAETALQRVQWSRWIPLIGKYYDAGDDIAQAGIFFTTALTDGIALTESLREPLGSLQASIDFMQLPRESRRTVLEALTKSPDRIHLIRENMLAGIDHLDRALSVLPKTFIPTRLTDARETLRVFDHAFTRFEDLAIILPSFAGYPEPTTSLFLFQNNTELRPTGGFIGAYGLLRTDNGVITDLRTDDVYRLDNGTPKDAQLPAAPAPIQRYLGVKKLFFRDANWSPDFPTSAQKLLDLYHLEDPRAPDIRSVVSITPTVLEQLMRFTGPIIIDDIPFTSENVTDTLEYEVEQGFAKKKISLEDRKVIVGKLTSEVVTRLHHIPSSDTPKLLEILGIALVEKQIMIYHRDPLIQQQIVERGWSGQFPKNGDALFALIDANLASLKTDQVVDRSLDIKVDYTPARPRATVTMTYANHGQFSWKTTRYQTYARLYAPAGSSFVAGDGFLDRPRSTAPGKVDVMNELGYSVFGGFTAIEPGDTKSIRFTIDLPERTSQGLKNNYHLHVPKQSGTTAVPLTL